MFDNIFEGVKSFSNQYEKIFLAIFLSVLTRVSEKLNLTRVNSSHKDIEIHKTRIVYLDMSILEEKISRNKDFNFNFLCILK